MNEVIKVILRTIFVLVILFTMFKIMGKKQVSQMNMFDYITGITIGSIVADISLDIDKNLSAGIICLLIYCFTDMFISYLNLKSITLRNFFEGKEVVLIENGIINRANMSKNKITINMLETEARIMGYFHLEEINNAILETNGKISFESKEKEKPISKKDMNIKKEDKNIVYNLIIDGKKQWLRARYDNEIRENIINKNYTDYELYFLTDSMLGNKNKFSVTLKDFRLNVGEKLYEIPGKLEFELDKNKALKATTEIAGNNETIKYKSMEEKIEKVIKTPLQNVINVKQVVGEITFDLTDERYVGDIEYEVFDQNGNKLISKFFDTDIKYIHKDGTIEQGEVGDGKENYNDIAKIVYEKSIVAEKSDNITSLIIKVYSINEYYGTRKQIGEYKADLKNNSIITETTKENIIQEIADVNDEERIQLSDIQDFSINLNDGVTSVTKINYTTGNKNKKIEVVGYEISINHEGYFTIVVMDKDKDYVFKSLSSNNVEQEKIKENNTKKAVLLKETYSSYNKYKTIIDQIELK